MADGVYIDLLTNIPEAVSRKYSTDWIQFVSP